MFRQLQSRIGTAWCSLTHESAMWPVHGQYECRTCGRHYPAFAETTSAAKSPVAANTHRPAEWLSRA